MLVKITVRVFQKTVNRNIMTITVFFSGYYLYIEASNRREDQVARLRSPYLDIPMDYSPICLFFFYHMYGSDVGELRVVREDLNGQQVLFSESGELFNIFQASVGPG